MTAAWRKYGGSLNVRSACLGKTRWQTERGAQQALSKMRREFPGGVDSTVRPYRCPFCARWHWGHEL